MWVTIEIHQDPNVRATTCRDKTNRLAKYCRLVLVRNKRNQKQYEAWQLCPEGLHANGAVMWVTKEIHHDPNAEASTGFDDTNWT